MKFLKDDVWIFIILFFLAFMAMIAFLMYQSSKVGELENGHTCREVRYE